MIRVEEAKVSDFDQIYELLANLNSDAIVRRGWQLMFRDIFKSGGIPGYILKDDDLIVGFFGTIFSKRDINGKSITFCNTHSWFVNERYRSYGLLLLKRIHDLKGVVLTNFSASTGPFQIMKQLKWIEVDNTHSIFFINPLKALFLPKVEVLKGDNIFDELSLPEKNIIEDHNSFTCEVNRLNIKRSSGVQIFKVLEYFPSKIKWLENQVGWDMKIGQLYYTSNPEILFSNFKQNLQAICKKEGWVGIVVPNRMLQKAGISQGKKYFGQRPILVKTDLEIDLNHLDLLYSEIFFLDLN